MDYLQYLQLTNKTLLTCYTMTHKCQQTPAEWTWLTSFRSYQSICTKKCQTVQKWTNLYQEVNCITINLYKTVPIRTKLYYTVPMCTNMYQTVPTYTKKLIVPRNKLNQSWTKLYYYYTCANCRVEWLFGETACRYWVCTPCCDS